jgi:hypothetical protein
MKELEAKLRDVQDRNAILRTRLVRSMRMKSSKRTRCAIERLAVSITVLLLFTRPPKNLSYCT